MNAAAQSRDGLVPRVHPLTPALVPAARITVNIECYSEPGNDKLPPSLHDNTNK